MDLDLYVAGDFFLNALYDFPYNLQEKNLVDICISTRALIYKSRPYNFFCENGSN